MEVDSGGDFGHHGPPPGRLQAAGALVKEVSEANPKALGRKRWVSGSWMLAEERNIGGPIVKRPMTPDHHEGSRTYRTVYDPKPP